ncbi:Nicotinate-nucleotide pyrophosphorylase [carboxylating] [Planctomycetes bacterium Pan216]|uniref:nicotinate-nucleotide diphosphorylase (carboxylating) n=1 Tax=Kolteria novifilia TaxID=2527975 RepID=A0A518BCL6_9BACT|nr:Nicotinate-nucleotide pyrophosphorylase [carboxylating] [Planctomycetes bacterium Pan216]
MFTPVEAAEADRLVEWGLQEDLGDAGDITSRAVIDPTTRGEARIVARQPGVVAGLPMLEVLRRRHPEFGIAAAENDGPVERGDVVAVLLGPLVTLLGLERLILNFLSHLGAIATLTSHYADAVADSRTVICDTRKTTPGWRYLEKYAVRIGGGTNHRIGLFDQVLIKDNHLAWLGEADPTPIKTAIERARNSTPPGTVVEIEVDTLEQFELAIREAPDIILLDNMSSETMAKAVARRAELGATSLLEASGGLGLAQIPELAQLGLDRVSVGALTHSAPSLDLSMELSKGRAEATS